MTPYLSLISLTALLVLLSPFPTLSASVLDAYGNEARNGGSYYVIPNGRGGGLNITQKPGEPSCPNYITRKTTSKTGLPTTIFNPQRTLFIPTSRVFFEFNTDLSTCEAPQGWNVITDSSTGRLYVVSGRGGSSGIYGFSLVEAGSKKFAYKIRQCSSGDEEQQKCGYVGFFKDNGLMGITDENPLVVRFKKVDATNGVSQIKSASILPLDLFDVV